MGTPITAGAAWSLEYRYEISDGTVQDRRGN